MTTDPLKNAPEQFSPVVAACLAFFLGPIGADFFYRRQLLAGFAIFAFLMLSYVVAPVGSDTGGIARHVPILLVLYGWIRAFLYIKNKGV